MTTHDDTYADDTTTLKRRRPAVELLPPTVRVFVPHRAPVDLDQTPTEQLERSAPRWGRTVRIVPVAPAPDDGAEPVPETVRYPHPPPQPRREHGDPPRRDPEALTYLENFLADHASRSSAGLAALPVTRRSSTRLPSAPSASPSYASLPAVDPRSSSSIPAPCRSLPPRPVATPALPAPAPQRPASAVKRVRPPRVRPAIRRVALTFLTLALLAVAALAITALVFGTGNAWAAPVTRPMLRLRDDIVAEYGPSERGHAKGPEGPKTKVVYFCPAPASAQVATAQEPVTPASAQAAIASDPAAIEPRAIANASSNEAQPLDLSKRDLLSEAL